MCISDFPEHSLEIIFCFIQFLFFLVNFKDRGGFGVRDRVRGCVRLGVEVGFRVRERMQLWICEKKTK